MPQMKPLNWFSLFIMFSLILMSKTMINFYNFNYFPINKTYNKFFNKKLNNNWKW